MEAAEAAAGLSAALIGSDDEVNGAAVAAVLHGATSTRDEEEKTK